MLYVYFFKKNDLSILLVNSQRGKLKKKKYIVGLTIFFIFFHF